MNFSIGNHERSLAEIMKELQDKAAELVLIGMFKKKTLFIIPELTCHMKLSTDFFCFSELQEM